MNIQTLLGRFWKAKKIESVYIVSINEGVSVITGLTHFIMDQKIVAGKISGAGISSHLTMRFFNPNKKNNEYAEFFNTYEIINILGSFFMIQKDPVLTLDVILKKESHTTLSGSLIDAEISGMNNFFIFPVGSGSIPHQHQFSDAQNWN
ncbi:hypothetical protein CHRYSEOSP005_31400 [Chryseobacterium sp. Alg-005]|uniref:PCC domain-containing protein n=1 Tax=Chryseobacterium sp. Alg-005 TaxID=3159516 RepID=UPI0035559BD9